MKKTILSILLVITLLVGMMPVVSASTNNRRDALFFFLVRETNLADHPRAVIGNAEVAIYRNGTQVDTVHTNPHGEVAWSSYTPGTYTARLVRAEGFRLPARRIFVESEIRAESEEFLNQGKEIIHLGTYDGTTHLYREVLWLLLCESTPLPGPALPGTPFTDVNETAWYATSVKWAFENEIIDGDTETTFAPGSNFRRESIVASLFRIYHGRSANDSDPRTNSFRDVSDDAWYAPYVTWATNEGLLNGVSATGFGKGSITRQDFAVLMYRFAEFRGQNTNVPGNFNLDFPDVVNIGSWAREGITWAVYEGLITGTGDSLAPRGTLTRAQAATILMRFVEE